MYIGGFSSGSLMSWAIAKGPFGHRLAGIIPYGCSMTPVGYGATSARYNMHILYTQGALDKICGYGGSTKQWGRVMGNREHFFEIAKARGYAVGAAEKRCAPCDGYVHCFQ